MSDTARITALNRAAWNASASLHSEGTEWDRICEQMQSGESRLDNTLTNALQHAGIAGARALQVGCNNGRELFSAMALGASEGWGIDQSDAFIAQAETLAALSPHTAQFICADIYALPPDTPRNFDIVFITIGVLNWMPDLPSFFVILASLLRTGGTLVIYETHPMLEMFEPADDAPYTPLYSYFRQTPHIETQSITYDGTSTEGAPESHWFPHSLSAIVQAALDGGLTLRELSEYPHSIREVDYDIYENQPAQLPMSYLLCATKG